MSRKLSHLPYVRLSQKQSLPEYPGIYFAVSGEQVLYIGQAENLKTRWQSHHRYRQLAAIDQQRPVNLFWLKCCEHELTTLEGRFTDEHHPVLNKTRVPDQQFIPSYSSLADTLEKLQSRLVAIGVRPARRNDPKMLVLGYFTSHHEVRRVTTNLRRSLRAINGRPNSLLHWVEPIRRVEYSHWRAKCNGVEVVLVPCSEPSLLHNPTLYRVMRDKCFNNILRVPKREQEAMRRKVRAMSFDQRRRLARSTPLGRELFPIQCDGCFYPICGVSILCLRARQLKGYEEQNITLAWSYSDLLPIDRDPIPMLF